MIPYKKLSSLTHCNGVKFENAIQRQQLVSSLFFSSMSVSFSRSLLAMASRSLLTAASRSSPNTDAAGARIGVAGALASCFFQMSKVDPFLSMDCARVEGVRAQSKERKGSNFAIWKKQEAKAPTTPMRAPAASVLGLDRLAAVKREREAIAKRLREKETDIEEKNREDTSCWRSIAFSNFTPFQCVRHGCSCASCSAYTAYEFTT